RMKVRSVLDDLAKIPNASRVELVLRWERAYGSHPPKGINRSLLERAAAWNSQAERLGSLPRHVKSVLRPSMKRTASRAKAEPVPGAAPIGSDLERAPAGTVDGSPPSAGGQPLGAAPSSERRRSRSGAAAHRATNAVAAA